MNFSERRDRQRTIRLKLFLGDSRLKSRCEQEKELFEVWKILEYHSVVGEKENIRKMRVIKAAQTCQNVR